MILSTFSTSFFSFPPIGMSGNRVLERGKVLIPADIRTWYRKPRCDHDGSVHDSGQHWERHNGTQTFWKRLPQGGLIYNVLKIIAMQ